MLAVVGVVVHSVVGPVDVVLVVAHSVRVVRVGIVEFR